MLPFESIPGSRMQKPRGARLRCHITLVYLLFPVDSHFQYQFFGAWHACSIDFPLALLQRRLVNAQKSANSTAWKGFYLWQVRWEGRRLKFDCGPLNLPSRFASCEGLLSLRGWYFHGSWILYKILLKAVLCVNRAQNFIWSGWGGIFLPDEWLGRPVSWVASYASSTLLHCATHSAMLRNSVA